LGEIVGNYYITGSTVEHGFSLKAGVFTTIDFPGSNLQNYPSQVNNFGVIAGGYLDANSISHGYVYNAGTFTAINFPGAPNTGVTGINDSGELSGYYCEVTPCPIFTPGPQRSFFTSVNGHFTTVNFAAITGVETSNLNLALNNAGQLVAAYQDSEGNSHGAVSAIGPFAYLGSSSIVVLDTSTNLVLTTIPSVGIGCVPVAITPTHLYIANFPGNVADVIDTTTNALQTTIPVGREPCAVAVTPDGKFGYVANSEDNTVSVFSTATNSVVTTVPVGLGPTAEAITPNGTLDYDYDLTSNIISVINTSTNSVMTTFSLVNGTWLAFSPNGAFAYITILPSSTSPGNVEVLAIPSNTVVTTVPVGIEPVGAAITPDGHYAYVANFGSNDVSVIDTTSNTVITTVPVGHGPYPVAITPDGANVYVGNYTDSTVSIIQVATNTVIATIPVTPAPFGMVISPAPTTSQSITQPLSPTAPNTFNYGPHNFTVTYPAGASFSGVNMTVVAAQATQASIQQRLAGTQFANAACIAYSGAGGNCLDYKVTCSNTGGSQITCPSESSPTITVKTSFDTLQPITNPGFLTTPIGTNNWTNIFDSFYLQRIDPTMKGKTSGFSEFVAVDLGATNGEGAGTFQFLAPLQSNDQRSFPVGASIPVKFHLASVANPAVPITDATAGITVVMISDASGNPTSNLVLEKPAAFTYGGGNYSYLLSTSGYAPGTYNITVYGNAFVAQQVEFTLTAPTGPRISTTLQSLTLNGTTKQYAAVFKISNTGGAVAKNLAVTAAKLDSTATVSSMPANLGNINAGSSVNVTLLFPGTAGAPKSSGEITISESYAGGTSGGGFRVTLP
jgi:YVTN family beta-propeller protein